MKAIFNYKTRELISNPLYKLSYKDSLKKAGIKKFSEYLIINLPNGRIAIKPRNAL